MGIGMEADAVRRRLHPEGVVSYAIECAVECGSSLDVICDAIEAAVDCGATGVRLAVAAGMTIEALEAMLRGVRGRFASLWIEGLTAAEVTALAAGCGLGLRETVARLRDSGIDSVAGGGVEVGDESAVQEWLAVHRVAHGLGMMTVAGMVFGAGETAEARVDFLEAVRGLQEETDGFAAFVPVAAAAPGGRELDGVTAVERLKTLAIARMFLDGIENVQVGAGQGLKVLQTALRFGANDAGWVTPGGASEEDVRRVIRDAGFKPAQRDAAYRAMMLS